MDADIYATTLIVAAFMTGLRLGSLAGGHMADRLSPAGGLRMFVAAELSVGTFGFFSRYVFYDWQYLAFASTDRSATATTVVVFLTLLWPTF